jgi:predicted phosphodiesterase
MEGKEAGTQGGRAGRLTTGEPKTGAAVTRHIRHPVFPSNVSPTMTKKPWTPDEESRAWGMRAAGKPAREIANALGRTKESVDNKLTKLRHAPPQQTVASGHNPLPRLPDPAPEAGGPSLPEPHGQEYHPFQIDGPGTWGVISDLHMPYHDRRTIELWADECKRRNVAGLFLNGDVLDFYHLSDHYKEPNMPRLKDELECGRAFFEWLRGKFPGKRIVWKYGNHDERLRKYAAVKAAELFDLPQLRLETLLRLSELGVETADDGRVVNLGKLPTVHGHEFRGQGGVMPARWLYLRTGDTAMCGHFHRTSYYTFRDIRDKDIGTWSLGCACFLFPKWLRQNQWNHGYAIVTLGSGSSFEVDNRRVLHDGRVV